MESKRREFFRTATAALAAAPLFVPSAAWGANHRVSYAAIGTGGRGRYLSDKFQRLGAECFALRDVYEPNLLAARKQSPDANTYIQYREPLEQKSINAVVIASPDHRHCRMLLVPSDAILKARKLVPWKRDAAPPNCPVHVAAHALASRTTPCKSVIPAGQEVEPFGGRDTSSLTTGRMILLVDDSPRIRPLVREILRDLHCQILEAPTAEEALTIAATQGGNIDLLLTDIAMPGMSGLELATELRRSYPGLPVLYMSGYTLPAATSSGMHFIEKPFRPDALVRKVREILGALE
jgi:CheY-like chemotaxis protein